MVISSLVIETTHASVRAAAEALARIEGVEVHNVDEEADKIVVTIEVDTIGESHRTASGFMDIPGVTNVGLVYANFEDEPYLKKEWARLDAERAEMAYER